MKILFTIIAAIVCLNSVVAQDVKIKKGEILIDKQAIAKIEKQKTGYKISDMDGTSWFITNAINVTQSRNIAPKFWLELTGANGNLREVEYRELDFTFSKEKWHVEALLNSDTGLLTYTGVDKVAVDQFFQTQDRKVSEKWDQIITTQRAENRREDELAKHDRLVFDGENIKLNGEKVASMQKQTIGTGSLSYTYTVWDTNYRKIATISFYREENLNKSNNGLFLKLINGQTTMLYQISYRFGKIDFDDISIRIVYRLYALGML